jgi:hypothetical protein
MLIMKKNGEGRRSVREVYEKERSLYSVDLVSGCAKFLETSKGKLYNEQMSNEENYDQAGYLHLKKQDFLEWFTAPISEPRSSNVVFVLSMGMGIESAFPQPTGQFDIFLNDVYLLSFNVTKENQTWQGNNCSFHYEINRLHVAPQAMVINADENIEEGSLASYGIGFLLVPKTLLNQNGKNKLRITSNREKMIGHPVLSSKRWVRINSDKKWRIGNEDRWSLLFKSHLDKGLESVCSVKEPFESGNFKVFFGDIHTHSGQSEWAACGTGTVDQNFKYARDVSLLDFYSLSEHDFQMPEEGEWELRLEKADKYNEDGRFVTIPSFEWTNQRYGHRNVYYRDTKWPFLDSGPKYTVNEIKEGKNPSPTQLWDFLKENNAKAFTVPHHPNVGNFPLDWHFVNTEFDRLVEVYSVWGNSEYIGAPFSDFIDRIPGLSVQDALSQGHKLGIIASSDGHDGHPGNSFTPARTIGSGLVAVLAKKLTREAVYDALYERRCYATTGTRILLDFKVNENVMGSEISTPNRDSSRTIKASVIGTTKIEKVEILRNNICIYKLNGEGKKMAKLKFVDNEKIDTKKSLYYFLRVSQKDGEIAWSSPIWVNTLE